MNKVRFLIVLPLVASGVLSGCNGSNQSTPATPATAPAAKTATTSAAATTTTNGQCTMPAVFTPSAQAQVIDVSQLSKMSGTFQLSSVNVYSQEKNPQGVVQNSFSAGAAIKASAAGPRDTKIQNICNQTSTANAYTETLPAVMTIHLPSLRVTEVDAGDAQDLPATNNPTYANFISDTQGNLSFKMAFSDKGPPYATKLSVTDWIATLPAPPTISLLSDGSIEMRIHWNEKNTISTDGYLHFQQK
jgi:hypothetical protein